VESDAPLLKDKQVKKCVGVAVLTQADSQTPLLHLAFGLSHGLNGLVVLFSVPIQLRTGTPRETH